MKKYFPSFQVWLRLKKIRDFKEKKGEATLKTTFNQIKLNENLKISFIAFKSIHTDIKHVNIFFSTQDSLFHIHMDPAAI